MGKAQLFIAAIVAIVLIASWVKKPHPPAVSDPANVVAQGGPGSASGSGPPHDAKSERIKVPSDAAARYFLVSLERRQDGDIEITTRREGKSGTSYSARQVDCSTGRFAYLADGDSWDEFSRSRKTGAAGLAPLTYGSVSYWIGLRACGTLPIAKQDMPNAATADRAPTSSMPVQPGPYDDKVKQWTWIAISQDGIRKKLKDPASAKFEDVFFSKSGGSPVACGRVNSKNGFGGYTGFQRFVAAGEVVGFLEEEAGPGEFASLWDRMCSRKG